MAAKLNLLTFLQHAQGLAESHPSLSADPATGLARAAGAVLKGDPLTESGDLDRHS